MWGYFWKYVHIKGVYLQSIVPVFVHPPVSKAKSTESLRNEVKGMMYFMSLWNIVLQMSWWFNVLQLWENMWKVEVKVKVYFDTFGLIQIGVTLLFSPASY